MTNAEAWFNIALRPRKPEGSLGRTDRTATSTLTQLLNYEYKPHCFLIDMNNNVHNAIHGVPFCCCFISERVQN